MSISPPRSPLLNNIMIINKEIDKEVAQITNERSELHMAQVDFNQGADS